MRTQINLPEQLYNKVRNVAEKIGMPIASFITLIVADTLQTPDLNFSKTKRQQYENYKKVNVTFKDEYYYGKMAEIIEQYKYSYTDLVIDCINYKLEKDFGFILENTNRKHSQNMRVLHQQEVVEAERTYQYSETTRQKAKDDKVPLRKYIDKKASNWGIKPKAVSNYYLARGINELMNICTDEIDIFCNPEDYI